MATFAVREKLADLGTVIRVEQCNQRPVRWIQNLREVLREEEQELVISPLCLTVFVLPITKVTSTGYVLVMDQLDRVLSHESDVVLLLKQLILNKLVFE